LTATVWPALRLFNQLPKEVFTWIVRGQIAAMAMPEIRELDTLREMGVSLLVSAVPTLFNPEAARRAGLRQLHIPIEYCCAPTREDIRDFVDAVRDELADGGKVAVHCVGGIGRTGTLIASYLVSEGMEPHEAIAFVRRRRRGSVENFAQETAVVGWALAQKEAFEPAFPDDHNGSEPPRIELVMTAEPENGETPDADVIFREEGTITMAESTLRGYLKWGSNGSDVDIRALSPAPGESPNVEELKSALRAFNSQNGVTVALTEVLGRDGEAWITVSCVPGQQASLLSAAGEIVDQLVRANIYDEVLLSGT
jgi:atypical dual specificity phosphatase